MDERGRKRISQIIAVVVGIVAIVAIRNPPWSSEGGTTSGILPDPGNCVNLSVTASSEKAALLTQMADSFNRSGETTDGRCIYVTVNKKASGEAMTALARGWNDRIDGPRPDVWSPASSSWVGLLRQRLAASDQTGLVPVDIPTIAYSPLVIAMPRTMAQALEWPDKPLGWSDIYRLATDPAGWASEGHPEWGPFKLGKTNPNYSTSGLHALIGSYYAATGLTSDLSLKDVASPKAQAFVKGVESSVYHYGDISLTFLANMQAADDRGEGLSYVSAVAIEEKSVWDYNQGNPSGDPATVGQHAPPSEPLVAIYPKEGTLVSDHPFVVLDAPWADPTKDDAAARFLAFLQAPAQQQTFQSYAFRAFDGTPGERIKPANGLLPDQPKKVLVPPPPEVLDAVLASWADLRKRARVTLLIDTSGSMDSSGGEGKSKLELAKEAATKALAQFAPDDEVSLWAFSDDSCRQIVSMGPVSQGMDALRSGIGSLRADGDTPLYECVRTVVDQMHIDYASDRINGVIVLSDGMNSVASNGDDCLDCLKEYLSSELGVRVFPIAYGGDADLDVLKQIAAASRAAAYDASDPTSIDKVFVSVISNF